MQIIAISTLKEFWKRHPRAEGPLSDWIRVARHARWRTPQDIKNQFGANVDFLADDRMVFDIAGNKFQLIARVSFEYGRVMIKFVGTHAEYDKVDAETVGR